MRERKKEITQEFVPSTLYRDDINSLIAAFSSVGGIPTLATGDKEEITPGELDQLGQPRLRELDITIKEPEATLSLADDVFTFQASEDTYRTAGLLVGVRKILRGERAERLRLWRRNVGLTALSAAAYFMGALVGRSAIPDGNLLVWLLLASLLVLFGAVVERRPRGVILLTNRPETFLVRNRDQILVLLIGTVLGGVVVAAFSAII